MTIVASGTNHSGQGEQRWRNACQQRTYEAVWRLSSAKPGAGRKVRASKEAERLWCAYQNQRQAALAARRAALEEIGATEVARGKGTMRWYCGSRDEIVETYALTPLGKKTELAKLDLELDRELAKWKAQAREARQAARRSHPMKGWVSFLRETASGGGYRGTGRSAAE